MVIAIASAGGQTAPFGGASEFTIFKIDGTRQKERECVPFRRLSGRESAELLVKLGVDLVICSAIDTASRRVLDEQGLHLVAGVPGPVDRICETYLAGNLQFDRLEN